VTNGDSTGAYSFIGLPSGNYKVRFSGGYLTQWYNNKADQFAADTVSVNAPNTTTGIDALLSLGGSISGNVTDGSGVPISGVPVTVFDANDNFISTAWTDASGNYVAKGIPTGNLKVSFQGSTKGYVNMVYGGSLYLSQAASVSVTAPGRTSGINATLALGGSISGTVTDTSGTPLYGITVQVYDTNSGWISDATTDASGNYTAGGIPAGTFKIAFLATGRYVGGRYAAQWYGGTGAFATATPVTVASITATTGVNAQLGTGASIFYAGGEKGFGGVQLNTTNAYRVFNISNYGTANLVLGTLTLDGADAGQFSLRNDACSGTTLAPGGNCLFRLMFTPTSLGPKNAAVTIPSNDPDTPSLVIAVNGTGAQEYTLTTNIVGSGAVNNLSQPPAFSCVQPSCTDTLPVGTPFTLHATPADTFEFSGWSGACAGSGDCSITLGADTTVTATFSLVPLIRIVGDAAPYRTLLAAYGAAATNAQLLVRDVTFAEALDLNHNVTVSLRGGFDNAFSANDNFSTLQGTLTVTSGSLVLENVIVR
jgi:phage gp45-like